MLKIFFTAKFANKFSTTFVDGSKTVVEIVVFYYWLPYVTFLLLHGSIIVKHRSTPKSSQIPNELLLYPKFSTIQHFIYPAVNILPGALLWFI